MPSKKRPDKVIRNPAVQLYDLLTALIEESKRSGVNQKDALCRVLQVPTDDSALLHARIAELLRLPARVKATLAVADQDSIYGEWFDPVQGAMSTLSGSDFANLQAFQTEQVAHAVIKLYMCRPVLADKDTLAAEQLTTIEKEIDEALQIVSAATNIDQGLKQRLLEILREASDVVDEARAAGIYAAREKLSTLMGRILFDPPLIRTAAESPMRQPDSPVQITRVAYKVLAHVVVAVAGKFGEGVAKQLTGKITGLLTGTAE